MSEENNYSEQQAQITKFFADLFGISEREFLFISQLPDLPDDIPGDIAPRMAGVMSLKNQPELAADAPWRLEPDQTELMVVCYVRDATIDPSGEHRWRLDLLRVEQQIADGSWYKLAAYLPADLPGVDFQGFFERSFWSHSVKIPLEELQAFPPGGYAHLRVNFMGSFPPYNDNTTIERHLEILRAEHALPLSRAAQPNGTRKWFYGDTHYHSGYTNDVKEYGGTIPEAREAGQSVGLDWLVITDHSVDLDEVDPGYSGKTRWQRLREELASPDISNDQFRFILGEEITLFGKDDRIVHMLAMGHMVDMIAGAFLPDNGGGFQADLYRETIKKIVKAGDGYHPDTPKQLFGQLHNFESVLGMLPEGTLTFAAHPYHVAQIPPAEWAEQDLSHLDLTGHEFWNTRIRKKARMTDNPFIRSGWTKKQKLEQRDRGRIKKLRSKVSNKWDPHLQRGVDEWSANQARPARRPVFIAGSDAHGDFNYHTGMAWDYSRLDMVDDNALGKVRTVVYLPDHQGSEVPGTDDILAALKKGACVVSDGPILGFTIQSNAQQANLGEVLSVSVNDPLEMQIEAHTTPEFGPVVEVEVATYFKGQRKRSPYITRVAAGETETIKLNGSQGYCRVQAQTISESGESFCCFSNPIWIRILDGKRGQISVTFNN
jgi:hypothetical protein